jgi:phage repressor protein C with HTH and peptisase S24 domain
MKKDGSEPADFLRIGGYEDCDTAFDVYGDMMAPRFRGGDVVICKTIEVSSIVRFGESYVIFSHGVPMIRYIKNEVDSETIKLGVENTRYEDTTMRKADIERLCIIKGAIRREAF